MPLYIIHWISAEAGGEVLLKAQTLEASDREAARQKALALLDDGGSIMGANKVALSDVSGSEPFWSGP
jgi:hypothetical protein